MKLKKKKNTLEAYLLEQEMRELQYQIVRCNMRDLQIFTATTAGNNAFCNVADAYGNTLMPSVSTGSLKIPIGKRNLDKAYPEFLRTYISKTKENFRSNRYLNTNVIKQNLNKPKEERIKVIVKPTMLNEDFVCIKIKTEHHLKRKTLKVFNRKWFRKPYGKKKRTSGNTLFDLLSSKPFNGCRGLRIRRLARKYRKSNERAQFWPIYNNV
jgi:hypothetical protein